MFEYSPATIAALKRSLTADRLKSYRPLCVCPVDDRAVLGLYVWNTDVCSAFYAPLQMVEMAFRNAIHRQMSAVYGRDDWYSDWKFKKTAPSLVGSLVESAARLTRNARLVSPANMVASMHFGFWTQLIGPDPDGNYTRSFWNAGLYRVFSCYPGAARDAQRRIRREILILKDFRNRVAHHEPIHNKKPEQQYERTLSVAGWLDNALPGWIDAHSACRGLFAVRPSTNVGR